MTPSVEAEARRLGTRTLVAGRDYQWEVGSDHWRFRMGTLDMASLAVPALPGRTQFANASAALATLHAMGLLDATGAPRVSSALRRLSLPGRFQVVPGAVEWILDVAHNEPAARVLARNLADRPVAGRTLCVAAILGDKDVAAVARELEGAVDQWFICGIDAPRGLGAAALAARSPVFGGATLAASIAEGMRLAAQAAREGDRIVVCGSFLAVAPALQLLGLY
jgi:dihydrofolate synthase/folylpolyglutamate synthase